MGLFDSLINPIERLITEHGSAAVLREHIGLIKAKLTEQESRCVDLQDKNERLHADLCEAQDRARKLEKELQTLKSGQADGVVCDTCGSASVKRTGSRPDPTFGKLGVKQGLFTCVDCGHVTSVMLENSGRR